MSDILKCLVVHDLCTYSKSSLTVVIPVLEALKVEACPIATAVLSTQTDGFTGVYKHSLKKETQRIFEVLETEKIKFDGFYSGFISDVAIMNQVEKFLIKNKENNLFTVIDPVLGDHGSYYTGFNDLQRDKMKDLIKHADLITPNFTEALLLTQKKEEDVEKFGINDVLYGLRELSPLSNIVITSIPSDQKTCKLAFLTKSNQEGIYTHNREKISLPGSGDFFCSVMVALMLRKKDFISALKLASLFTEKAIKRTIEAGFEEKHGICPSLVLSDLSQTEVSN
ncbi:MAG: bifunctional hydroxymethylpyrimidine kinase/phosphomethylpyrimidine kinase [Sphaerochaetaceae bacterium]|nr:PfkB family carbohydrate kinase [Sphaerochaetaceae bacterium]